MGILIDTGIWVGYFNTDDSLATRSNEIIEDIQRGKFGSAWITTFIVDELFTFLIRRTHNLQLALDAATIVIGKKENITPFIHVYSVTHEDCLEALKLAKKYSNKVMNFTDLVSIVSCNKLGLSYIASYDKHFSGILSKIE